VIAVDTSLVVALFASWHEAHESAREAVPAEVHLPAHVLLESYSVLTRLPPPHRAPPEIVESFLRRRFQAKLLTLPGNGHGSLLKAARDGGISGGGVYDALVAATAKHAEATLLTRDRRAVRVYETVGVTFRMVG
jgi:predicted nucleic acid-binding protein